MAYNHLGSKPEAEHIVQEVFEKLWKRRAVSNIEYLPVYLMAATKNLSVNFIKSQITFRKYQEYLIFQELQQMYHGQDIINYNDLVQAIDLALQSLPEKTAEVFTLSRFENLSNKEIAGKLCISEKTVEYHITKSLQFFRTHLQHYHSKN